jgi:hypothetical protein
MVAPAPAAESSPQAFAPRTNVLLPGLYAWATTVARPVFSSQATLAIRLAAACAVLVLLCGPLLSGRFPRLGRALGVHAFVGFSVLTWALLRHAGVPFGGQALEAAFGAVGWTLYAFGWGELSSRRRVPEQDPHVLAGAPLSPKGSWSRSAEVILGLGVLGAIVILVLAFRVARPSHAVMAHALALLLSLLVISAASRVALERSPRRLGSSAERFGSAATALALLLIALALGALYWLLER